MSPHVVLTASLVASLLLSAQVLLGASRGQVELLGAALRWAAAFGLARLCLGWLARLVAGYAAAPRGVERRRRTDDATPGAHDASGRP